MILGQDDNYIRQLGSFINGHGLKTVFNRFIIIRAAGALGDIFKDVTNSGK